MLASRTQLRSSAPLASKRSSRVAPVTKAYLEPAIAIGGSTVALLALGRFVFLPYQRREAEWNQESAGPKTTGNTFFNNLSKPAAFVGTSKDPAGFGVVDVFAWGALGHAIGYGILASQSLNAAGVSVFPR